MALNDNESLRRLVESRRRRILDVVLMLAIISLILALIVSCGSDSTNPAGPGDSWESGFKWTTAPPEEHGFDPELLDTLTSRLYWGDLGRITSVLITCNGYLVYEEYFRGCTQTTQVNIYSCTKSVTSALMGIAIAEGSIGGVDDRLFDYLDGYNLFPHGELDSLNRENMTVEHLLTMTAGFAWDEWNTPYGHSLNSYNLMVNSDDWIQYTLDQRVVSPPGTAFEYNTGLSGLMAVVLKNSIGLHVDDYARQKLFRPIGIDNCSWRMTPQGFPMTGNALELRPRDMAKFGWLYSQNGVWDGDTIVPSWWVQASCQPYSTFSDGKAYGYQWWMVEMTDDDDNPFYMPYALGYGGQHIFIPPMYDMVIVVTAADDLEVSGSHIVNIMNLIGEAFTP